MGFGLGGGLLFGGGNTGSSGSGTGSSGSDPLIIGGVTFLDEEHPDDISFPLDQTLAVHVNIGGSRTVQALGPNPTDITWTGKLFDQNLQPRLAALKAMEVSAQQVSLSYLDQSYTVVVRKFTPGYKHRYLGSYSITVTVIADTSGQFTQTPPPSIDDQVGNVEQAAQQQLDQLAQTDPTGSQALQAQWNLLFAELASVGGPLAQLTGPALQNLIALAGAAYEAAQTYLNGNTNGNSASYLQAQQLSSYALLISKNLAQGQSPAVVMVQGGTADLFDIATQVYGDPSLAFELAAANGLISPILSSGVNYQIVLPPLQSTQAAA